MYTTMTKEISWALPLDRTHTGIPLANGVQGLMIWGRNSLNLTVSRAGFWDRRGGNPFLSTTTYREVKDLLQAGDEEGLLRVFGQNQSHQDPARPHQLGGGLLRVPFPPGWTVSRAVLLPREGCVRIEAANGEQRETLRIRQAAHAEWARVELPADWPLEGVELRPSWHWISDKLRAVGCEPPREWRHQTECGFMQNLPEDDPLVLRVALSPGRLCIVSHVGEQAERVTAETLEADPDRLLRETDLWWRRYHQQVPRISLPDPLLREMVDLGLYFQACCTPAHGLACTLQGPLMECDRIPPWSNDYHLNINLQMVYTPALAGNCAEHFQPLWELIRGWMPDLIRGGTAFFEDPEALMLPHALDDRCHVVGSFWTGSIDHGCTAWMALLAFDYVRYTGDETVLREIAWPLLKGAWAGFRAMLEPAEDGRLHLPVSVSPEYKGSRMDARGRDSSFQLAAVQAVLLALPRAAQMLDEPVDPEWGGASARIPSFSAEHGPLNAEYPERTRRRIVLWEGQDLDGSHRHHSHLAGITPFRTLDPRGEEGEVLFNSLHHWVLRGPGAWSGWSLPWAAMLHARCGQADAAVQWLHNWKRVFTNRGHASLHDADFPGFSTLALPENRDHDIMQLDGRFGTLSAIFELLVQDWNDEIRVLPRLPGDWEALDFDGICAPGGFQIGATVRGGRIREVRVHSLRGSFLRLRIGDQALIEQSTRTGDVLKF